MQKAIALLLAAFFYPENSHAFPTVCTVVNTSAFREILNLEHAPSVCGFPPRPCVKFKYSWPDFFIETTGPKETFFSGLPGVAIQLGTTSEAMPFATEDDNGEYSFHAHTIGVTFSKIGSAGMPCEGGSWDRFCFSAMSEHLGSHWKTGKGDLLQPSWLAWSLSPKACLLKGGLESVSGNSTPTGYPNVGMCSFDHSWLPRFPPSNQPVCTGWGFHFPRYGTVTSSDQTTASLVIADRIRTLASEVFSSVPTDGEDVWQMISPNTSNGFRRGQNVGLLRAKQVSEWNRLTTGKMKNYLYVVWRKQECSKDIPYVVSTQVWLAALQAACKGLGN